MMRALTLLAAASLGLAAPATAQEAHSHEHGAGGMDHMHNMPGMDMPGDNGTETQSAAPTGDDTPGKAAPPPIPGDHPADRYFPKERMDRARAALMSEGSWTGGALLIDRLEYRAGAGHDGYAWKASGWYGNDIDRAVIVTEGEGRFREGAERIEVQALWRHAIGPWFNLEAGARHDFRPRPERTYAVLGIEGLAPYWIEVEAQFFLSNKGDAHLRLAASHDIRLSGPLVFKPEAEVNAALQDVPQLGIGSGIERLELGGRLRYEIRPDLAPYVGVNWERSFGGTARAQRAAGERASAVTAVAGLHAFF